MKNDPLGITGKNVKIRNIKRGLDHWVDYIMTRNDINNKPDKRLLDLIEEMTIKYPNQDSIRLKGLKRMVELGGRTYTQALVIAERGNMEFKN